MNDQLLDQPMTAERLASVSGPALWEILWQRKSYIALGAVVGLVLGVLYWSMAPRTYESSAQIWVVKRQQVAPISADTPSLAAANVHAAEDFLSTHRTLIRSAVILGNAITKGGLHELATFHASSQPARALGRSLTVSRDRDKSARNNSNSQILNISFRCSHPEDCAPVLSAVIDSYRDFLDNSTEGSAKKTLDLIEQARELLEKELKSKREAYDDFRRNMPVLWKTAYGTTQYQQRLGDLDAQRAAQRVRIARLRATLDAVDTAIQEGRSRADLLDLVSALPNKAPLTGGTRGPTGSPGRDAGGGTADVLSGNLEQQLIQLQLEEGKLLEDYGPEHPRVKTLRDHMQTIRSLLAPSTTPEAETAEQRARDTRAKEKLVDLRIGQLKQELAEAERGIASLDTLYQTEMREAKKVLPYEIQEESLRRAITDGELLYQNIIKRLNNLNLVSDSGDFETQVITPPTPTEKISPRGSLVLPMALFLGLLLGSGLAYLADMTDKSFRSPEDVRRQLGLPIMGVIPLVKSSVETGEGEAGLGLAPNIYTWHRRASKEAEAYRGVRTALYFSTHGQGCKVIQVTSPNQGDGKSTLAANLAVSIAQSGKSVLLVDADLRRPRIDMLFGIAQPIGFAAVLGGLAEVPEAISATTVPGLFALPAGPLPPNPAELLTAPRLREALEWMRERYEYIIVDTPPLLAVTDPGVVGPQVDGVILALRSTKKGRVEAKRAKEVLDNLGVNIFGVVLNALDQGRSHASYGYYGYENYESSPVDAGRNGEDRRALVGRVEEVQTAHESNRAPVERS